MMGRINLKNMVIIIVLAVIFAVGYIRQEITMDRLSKEIDIKLKELDELKDNNERLQDEVNQCNTDEYIERLARERLGMIKEGEKVILNAGKAE